ncbi:DUF3999 domain-containing protein [Chitiniphilus shinanonensis]|uniref:DUF3999 domain-containing protein n=1 Tax=Chitiniphilus shinanonensis TaxID=553088 RepID=UPI0003AA84CB|nr:DUF3999 domain-containing protein [Chitiniphilus shinanonensis]
MMSLGRSVVVRLLCLGTVLWAAAAPAADGPDDYAVRAPLALSGQGPWYRLTLPFDARLAARHADLRDLRVFDAQGQAVPYALREATAPATRSQQEIGAKLFPLRGPAGETTTSGALRVLRNSEGTIVEVPAAPAGSGEPVLRGWLLDLGAGKDRPRRLTLSWGEADEGFQRFAIDTSDDLNDWRPLGSGQIARFSFNGEHIDQPEVELPDAPARYLRLQWLSPQQAPELRTARLDGTRSQGGGATLSWSGPLSGRVGKDGEYLYRLPLALPLTAMRVSLDQPNTVAPVTVSGRLNDHAPWQWLMAGVLTRVPAGKEEIRLEEIVLPGQKVNELKLAPDQRGAGLGAQAPAVRVALPAMELVFLARGTPPYRLALGKANAQSAALPLTTLVPGYDDARLAAMGSAKADLAPADAARQTASATAVAAGGDWRRWALWGLLLAGVGLLAAMAASLVRRSRREE